MLPRFLFPFAVIFLFAILSSVSAQELRDRELHPAFDFTTIQMPVEIVSIKINGKEIKPGEKIKGDDDWLQGLSFSKKYFKQTNCLCLYRLAVCSTRPSCGFHVKLRRGLLAW